MELVFAIGKPAFKVEAQGAEDYVFAYACGLDMTRRDLQIAAREKGRPWDIGKGFEQSAVIAPMTKAASLGELNGRKIALSVNGTKKQSATLDDLVWKVRELIAHLSQYYHLTPGDIVYTGTPAGVGPVVAGDQIEGTIDGLAPVQLTIAKAEWQSDMAFKS
jgi:fumarylpyruvate hydrolase